MKNIDKCLLFHGNHFPLLTVKSLYPQNIVLSQLDIWKISFVPRIHDGFPYIGMFQTQAMSELMNRHSVQVYTFTCTRCKLLIIVKMNIAR